MAVVDLIKDDLSNLQEVVRYYDAEFKAHVKELALDMKTYSRANSEQAGLLGFYDQLRCELEVMLDDMKMRYDVARYLALRELQKNESKTHPERTLNMLIDGNKDVILHHKAKNEIDERLKKAKSIVGAFVQRGHSLHNLVKARTGEFQNEPIYVNE